MRVCIWLIAFASSAALAHGAPQGRDSSTDAHAPDRGSPRGSPNFQIREPARGAQDGNDANDTKAADERQRFCVRNHIGKVNCVMFPSAGH